MGFKTWRNLSVLAFAGVALVGCNTGAQKDTTVIKSGPTTSAQTNQTQPGGFSTNNAPPFPTSPKTPPFTPTSGTGAQPQFGAQTGQVNYGSPSQPNMAPSNSAMQPSMSPYPTGPGAGLAPLPPAQSNMGAFSPPPSSPAAGVVPSMPAGPSNFATQGTPTGPMPIGGIPPGPVPIAPPPNGLYR